MTPSRISHVAVVVPARDEAERIARTIASVQRARASLPSRVRSSLVVVVDASSDATADIANEVAGPCDDVVVLVDPPAIGCVGSARAHGARIAIDGHDDELSQLWIASTDADTVVPTDWLVQHLQHADRGHVGVAGVVDLLDDAGDGVGFRRRFASVYDRTVGGSHPHVHGANLGFRADTYVAVGGWSALATGEDHDLWRRLRHHGPVLSTAASVVRTSSRRVGRAPDGFAADLVALDRTLGLAGG